MFFQTYHGVTSASFEEPEISTVGNQWLQERDEGNNETYFRAQKHAIEYRRIASESFLSLSHSLDARMKVLCKTCQCIFSPKTSDNSGLSQSANGAT